MKKSDRTRAAILAAARLVFAENGYEGTTVRAVAAQADIDPAMIIRYFGNKENLFAMASTVNLSLPDIGTASEAEIAVVLVGRFLQLWEGEGAGMGLPILLRSAMTHAAAQAKVRDVFKTQVVRMFETRFPAALAEERAGLVLSQLFGMALCRYVLDIPPLNTMTGEKVIAAIAPVIAIHLSQK
ncbi:TetR family transcriptional regulator [Martelella sp. HB161492]|uniref:TetR/AcrR family transcriptional regulator n=1 Tax=Martelella sp. HB161492 TaxID=2720726 RepID=UPI001590EB4A